MYSTPHWSTENASKKNMYMIISLSKPNCSETNYLISLLLTNKNMEFSQTTKTVDMNAPAFVQEYIECTVRYFSDLGFETSSVVSDFPWSKQCDLHLAICVKDSIPPIDLWNGISSERTPKQVTLWFQCKEDTLIINCFLTFHIYDMWLDQKEWYQDVSYKRSE